MVHTPNIKMGKEGTIVEATQLKMIPQFSVKYKDVFNLKNLYVMMHELLQEEGWYGWEGNDEGMATHSDLEVLYSENNYQKGIHHGGKEFWIWWRAKKRWMDRGSENYWLDTLDIDWHVVGSSDIEIVHQGKKLKVQRAELEIFFTARILSDIGLKWEKHPILKHLKPFHDHRIMHAYVEKREKELWRDVFRLQSKLKAYLKLRSWAPEGFQFHSPMTGWEGQF